MTQNNLDATVFVYQHRHTREIRCEYIGAARQLEDAAEWEHLATLEPRLWIQHHWNDAAAERDACAKLCESEWSNVAERMYGQELASAIRARGHA